MIAGLVSLLQGMQNSTAGNRVYLIRAPVGAAAPFITIHVVGLQNNQSLDNFNWVRTRVQIDVWAADYATAEPLRKLVLSTLQGYRGTLSDGDYLANVDLYTFNDYDEQEALLFRLGSEYYLYDN